MSEFPLYDESEYIWCTYCKANVLRIHTCWRYSQAYNRG